MDNKFTVIKGNADITGINRIMRTVAIHDCWKRQYQNAIDKAMEGNKGKQFADCTQEGLIKIALSGVKYINSLHEIKMENERTDTGYTESLEESKAKFNLIDAIFTVMGYIKLKNLIITFPVTKNFDGHKWESKDYFYTMGVLSKMDWDKPVGCDEVFDFLWDYENEDLRNVCIDYMCAMSAVYRSQTGKGIAEQFCEDHGTGTYTADMETGIMKNNQTGDIVKPKKAKHIKIVK